MGCRTKLIEDSFVLTTTYGLFVSLFILVSSYSSPRLSQILGGTDTILFQSLPELVNRFLAPPEPIIFHYTIAPTIPPPERPQAWDLPVQMEDTTLKGRMTTMLQANKEITAELSQFDDQVRIHITFSPHALSLSHANRSQFTPSPCTTRTSNAPSWNPLRKIKQGS